MSRCRQFMGNDCCRDLAAFSHRVSLSLPSKELSIAQTHYSEAISDNWRWHPSRGTVGAVGSSSEPALTCLRLAPAALRSGIAEPADLLLEESAPGAQPRPEPERVRDPDPKAVSVQRGWASQLPGQPRSGASRGVAEHQRQPTLDMAGHLAPATLSYRSPWFICVTFSYNSRYSLL